MDRISRLLTLPLISVLILNTACQSQEKDNAPVNKDHVPSYVNLLPAINHPEQVYHLELRMCPRGLEELTKLEYLYFGPCYVSNEVMADISKSKSVLELAIYDCKVEKLEFSEHYKKNLILMNLPFTIIKNIDYSLAEISEFNSLETLGFNLSNIPYFPESWTKMDKLKRVYFGNDIEKFDFKRSFNNLSQLKSLEEIAINSSNIEVLPSNFQKLNKLQKITVYNCPNLKPSYILSQIKDWNNLSFLGLSYMFLTTLPEELVRFQNLKAVDLAENEKLDFEQAFGVLSKIERLEELNLSYCISSTKDEMLFDKLDMLAELKNLKKLDFTHNEYVDSKYFWGLLGHLVKLEELILAEFPAQIFPDIHKLTNLRILDIRNTGPRNMENIEKFPPSLRTLKYSGSLLDDFPMEIINSPNLESVNLNNNDILVVPDEISEMKNLFHLDLGYNKLTELPESIKELKGNLKYLNLMGNPLNDNAETCEQIKKWLPNTEIFWGE